MKTMSERIRNRMKTDRKIVDITLRLPEDVIADLDEVAPSRGLSGHMSVIRSYISSNLREDIQRLYDNPAARLTVSLKKHGLSDEVISTVLAEANLNQAPQQRAS